MVGLGCGLGVVGFFGLEGQKDDRILGRRNGAPHGADVVLGKSVVLEVLFTPSSLHTYPSTDASTEGVPLFGSILSRPQE